MSKGVWRKRALSTAGGASFTCLVMMFLLVAVIKHRGTLVEEGSTGREFGTRSLQSLNSMNNNDKPVNQAPAEDRVGQKCQATQVKGFSAYFSELSRGKRAVEHRAVKTRDPTPVEELSPADVFIAVKTTKKYHHTRLDLLLDTWISRNMLQVIRKTLHFQEQAFPQGQNDTSFTQSALRFEPATFRLYPTI